MKTSYKTMMKTVIRDIEVDAEYPKNLFHLHSDLLFLSERKKIKKVINLFVMFMTKNTMLFT